MQLLTYAALLGFAVLVAASPENDNGITSSTADLGSCIAACDPKDICCPSTCLNIDCGNVSQIMDYVNCVTTQCDVLGAGDSVMGCVTSCYNSFFAGAGGGVATATTGSAATSIASTADSSENSSTFTESRSFAEASSDSQSSARFGSGSQSDSGSESDSTSSPEPSSSSDDQNSGSRSASSVSIGVSAVGILATLIAGMAL